MTKTLAFVIGWTLVLSGSGVRGQPSAARLPIIDVHLHGYGAANWKGAPQNP
jgi:hypothetical protein